MLLDAAHQIGIRIARAAHWDGGACAWTIPIAGPSGITHRPAGPSLYTGSAGIALFLAELSRLTGDAETLRAAHGALRHAVASARAMPPTAFGFHAGRVGIAFAAWRAGDLLGAAEYADAVADVLAPLAGNEAEDRALDVMGGGAGAIPVLLRMSAAPGREALRPMAIALGEHLLRVAEREPGGWSWRAAGPVPVRNLAGLAHGASGMGHALLELFRATGDGRFLHGGEQAFAYERQFFDPAEGSWPDLRHAALASHYFRGTMDELRARLMAGEAPAPHRPGRMMAWCHGAPGIGLARLRGWQTAGHGAWRGEAEAAVEATRAWLGAGHAPRATAHASLCHGTAGNAETLWMAAEVLDRPALRDAARTGAWDGWEAFDRMAGRAPREPGLMLGEAGIGHAFLRMHGADVPSVLLPTVPDPPPAVTPDVRAMAEPLRRQSLDAWFGRALRVVERTRGTAWTPPPPDDTPDTAAAYARLRAAVDGEPDAALRARLDDALRPEEARWQAALAITDHAARFMAGLVRRAPADVPWDNARFRLAPHARQVCCAWDWDAWLHADAGTAPEPRTTCFAVHEAGTRARLQRLVPLAARVLDALAEPRTLAEVAARIVEETGAPAAEVDTVSATVRAQAQALYAAGVIDIV